MKSEHNYTTYEYVRNVLIKNGEIALLDVREEHPHAQSHPLFAANFSLSRIELNVLANLPRMDVRSPEEYVESHLENWRPVPGGQLIQETEMVAPVRGARIVLTDSDGVRANMTASWLSQMNWNVYVLDSPPIFNAKGAWKPVLPAPPIVPLISPDFLSASGLEKFTIIDISPHSTYIRRHIPGAWYAIRSQFKEAVSVLPASSQYVITCTTGVLSQFAQPELSSLVDGEVLVLDGGTSAWIKSGLSTVADNPLLASPPIDRYRRPYEGTDNPHSAMQA